MKSLTFFGMMVCVGLLFAPAASIAKEVQDVKVINTPRVKVSTVYQFAEYAGPTFANVGGILNMHAICKDELDDAAARMCTSKEYWDTPDIAPTTTYEAAWILPSRVGQIVFIDQHGNQVVSITDYSGYRTRPNDGHDIDRTCNQYNEGIDDRYGMVVSTMEGTIGTRQCNTRQRVACCLPATR